MSDDHTDRATAVAIRPESAVSLLPLTVVRDATDSYIIGNASAGSFLRVPTVATIVVAALQRGESVGETRSRVARETGEDVDVDEFVSALAAVGLVEAVDGVELGRQ